MAHPECELWVINCEVIVLPVFYSNECNPVRNIVSHHITSHHTTSHHHITSHHISYGTVFVTPGRVPNIILNGTVFVTPVHYKNLQIIPFVHCPSVFILSYLWMGRFHPTNDEVTLLIFCWWGIVKLSFRRAPHLFVDPIDLFIRIVEVVINTLATAACMGWHVSVIITEYANLYMTNIYYVLSVGNIQTRW